MASADGRSHALPAPHLRKTATAFCRRQGVGTLKKNILAQTNLQVCIVIVVGFLLTATLSYRSNFNTSLENIEQVSTLTSEGIYFQLSTTLSKPINISLTMANDSLLQEFLTREKDHLDDQSYIDTIKEYLNGYRIKYNYDSVFLVSTGTNRYYNFNGLDRVLAPGNPENLWYFDTLLGSDVEYTMNVDNDEVNGSDNAITVFVNCKIKDASGILLGVVGVGVRIDNIQRTLQEYKNQFNVNAYLIDEEGIIEISTDYSGYEEVNLFEVVHNGTAQARQKVLGWKQADTATGFWSLDSAGLKEDYVVARYLPELQWHLVVERDTSAVMATMHRQFILAAVVIAIILATILFIITSVIRRFNRRIVDLTQAMEKERKAIFEKATEQLFETIYEVDVTHNLPANKATEAYFQKSGAPPGCSYETALHIIAKTQIKEEFQQGYIDTLSPHNVMRTYEAGKDSFTYEFMTSKDHEQYYWMRVTAQIVKWETDNSIHMLVYRQNIDTEKRRESQMRQLAQTDEMTGLLTKTATHRQVEELLLTHPGESFTYFIFDIDNFKQANDQFGHEFGDTVICAFAQTIRELFRQEDVVGRIGGDEFVVFARGNGHDWAKEKAEALRKSLFFTHTWSDSHWQVSASIGVALAPEQGQDAGALYRNADAALYQTKKQGKNGFTIYDGNLRNL